MRFFTGCRPEVYIHGAKLRRDKKTGKRLWGLTLIVTLDIDQVLQCGKVIESAYGYILTLDNLAVDVMLSLMVPGCTVDFFALVEDKNPALHLERVDLGGLRMTRDGETVELWFQFEAELEYTPGLHEFVKKFAYTRLWAQFSPRQGDLEMSAAEPGESK